MLVFQDGQKLDTVVFKESQQVFDIIDSDVFIELGFRLQQFFDLDNNAFLF